jgi:uncharacterized tellurite resistance protein B-like protein
MTADEWLARAIVRMIISDNVLNRKEWKSLKSSIERLGIKVDMDEIDSLLDRQDALSPEEFRLEPFTNIPLESKMKMLMNLVKVAAIDREVVKQEKEFFRKATALLGLNNQIANELLDWADSLVNLNQKEEALLEFAKTYQNR